MNALTLTQALIPIRSVSNQSNEPIANFLQAILEENGWTIERTAYIDPDGIEKINLVAKLGEGTGGLAFCSHVDTVPGQEEDWPAFTPEIRDGNLWGRGSCDMKGPIAATIEAALSIDPKSLKKPIYIVLTSDEELGLIGAKFIKSASTMLKESKPAYGIIAEPTNLIPVYSHKGYSQITVTAKGRAAHSSTGKGDSSMIKSIPFLTELYELEQTLQADSAFQNDSYNPPHHTMNIKVDSGKSALNVTAPKTTIHIAIRTMPNSRSRDVSDLIVEKAHAYGFEVDVDYLDALYCPPESELVQRCVTITGKQPETVSYGTDGNYLMDVIGQLVVLGPGDIDVAHTIREHVPIAQLEDAVRIYKQLIADFCL